MDEWDFDYGWIDERMGCWLWMDRWKSGMLVMDGYMDE